MVHIVLPKEKIFSELDSTDGISSSRGVVLLTMGLVVKKFVCVLSVDMIGVSFLDVSVLPVLVVIECGGVLFLSYK